MHKKALLPREVTQHRFPLNSMKSHRRVTLSKRMPFGLAQKSGSRDAMGLSSKNRRITGVFSQTNLLAQVYLVPKWQTRKDYDVARLNY